MMFRAFRETVTEAVTEDRERFNPGFNGVPFPPNTAPIQPLSMPAALSVPAFWRGVRLKSELISGFPLTALNEKTNRPIKVQPDFLTQPDPTEDRHVTINRLVTSLVLRGNAFAMTSGHDEFGFPHSMKVLNPDFLGYRLTDTGTYEFMINGQFYDPSIIFHALSGVIMPWEPFACGVIEIHRRTLDHSVRLDEFSRNYFRDNAIPSVVITVKNRPTLSRKELADMKTRWMAQQGGNREPVFIDEDLTVTPLSLKPEDSQFLQTKVQSITDVANILGLPPYFLGGSNASMTYSNIEVEAINLLKFSLNGEITAIERAFSNFLPDGIIARFDTDAILRNSTIERFQAMALARQWRTLNEVRAMDGLPPVPDGDVIVSVQPALSPFDHAPLAAPLPNSGAEPNPPKGAANANSNAA